MLIPNVTENGPSYQSSHLFVALIIAAMIHGLLIFGVNFGGLSTPDPKRPIPRMEVTLVNSHSDTVPDHVDFLAQANQEGGGNVQESVRPETQSLPLIPLEAIQSAPPTPPQMASTKEAGRLRETLLTQTSGKHSIKSNLNTENESTNEPLEVATLLIPPSDLTTPDVELGEQNKHHAKIPRRKFISPATKEYKYANYMESWRKKVEKTGNLNFPPEVKRRNLFGSLILDIAINSDGSIRSFNIARSSGHKILDDAALKIVYLAAPFAPLPPDILKETDVLHITRTWTFLDGDTLGMRMK